MRIFRLLSALFLSACFMVEAQAFAHSNAIMPLQKPPEMTVRFFYQWYLRTLNNNQEPFKNKVEMRKYATERLIREITKAMNSPDGLDYHYFINAQDFDESWEKNMVISKAAIRGSTAIVNVAFRWSADTEHKLKVSLKQETAGWKIDKVEGIE